MTAYFLCIVLFCIGVYCVIVKRNIIKIIVGVSIADNAVNLFFVLIGYRSKCMAPILSSEGDITKMVDPLPQALVLTSIVIGLATTALLVAIAMRLYEKYRTYDITKIRELKG